MDKKQSKKYKKSSQQSNLAVQKGLMNIYSNKDGSLPDISHLDVRRRSRLKLFVISFIIFGILVSAITWLGYLLFNPNVKFSDESIKLTIESQQSIASGDEVIYQIRYENIEKITLHDIQIIIRYPNGFVFDSARPEADNNFNTTWEIGSLGRDQSGLIEIRGRLIGEVGSLNVINVTASYRPENFSSSFKESRSFSSQITSSILELEIEGPEQILTEKKVEYKIIYKNNSEQKLTNIKILVEYQENFVFQEAIPEAFSREEDARKLNNQWIIETLDKNQEGEIEIIGGYLAEEDVDQVNLKVQIGFYNEEDDEFLLQQEKTLTTQLVQPGLSLDLIINGSATDQPISFDQALTYSIVYKNLGQAELDDVEIVINLISDILDWDTLNDKNNGKIENNSITWTMEEISSFDLVRPLDEGTINFTIRTKLSDNVNPDSSNLQLTSKAFATLKMIGDLEVEDLIIESEEIKNNINTDLQLKVTARYFNDDNIAVGTGPLPPVVGQKTSFRIYWALANSLNAVEDVEVSTILPKGIEWDDKFLAKAGAMSYSAKNNKVTWTINNLPANKNFEEVNVWFDVALIPTPQQERKLIILTDQTELTAIDSASSANIYKTGKATTSNLEDDPIGGGRGLVIDLSE